MNYSNQGFQTNAMSNPVIRRLGRVTEVAGEKGAATYRGIAGKTIYFLMMTVVGIVAYYILHNIWAAGEAAISIPADSGTFTISMQEIVVVFGCIIVAILVPILTWFIRGGVAFFGTIYGLAQGYLVGFMGFVYGGAYQYLVWLALVITLVIVFVMLMLYTTRTVRVTEKFNMVIRTLFFTCLCSGVVMLFGMLIPVTAPMVRTMAANPVISIISSVIFIVIAALFLLSDFDVIEKTVEYQLPKKYEWNAAFGLAMTVIWLYLKILRLLMKIRRFGKR